ncbi:MAG: hypothetical protein AAGB00_08725 [Planctomycetota bacterium]
MPRPHQFAGIAILTALAAGAARAQPRAEPPEWTDSERELFPADARQLLVGPRPDFSQRAAAAAVVAAEETATESYAWSALISTDTVEGEIKRQANRVAGLVQSATAFKGGGYREARDAFSMLAVMFAIAAEHDGDARWRDRAASLSALFSRAGANCKVGTDGSFREAAARSQDLADLVRGGRPDTPKPDADRTWGDVADRVPLMRRMEVAQQEQLSQLTANAKDFSRGAEEAAHEAQVLAALAEVIIREGFTDADDESYADYARELRDASAEIARSAEQDLYDPARAALGRATKSCSACHEDYRG